MASPDELVRLIVHLCEIERFMHVEEKRPKRHKGISLSDSEMWALLKISRQEGQSQSELCHRMNRSKGVTSCLVDRLEEKSLVHRDKVDTRCRLYLTGLGRSICLEKLEQDSRRANEAVEEIPVELEDLRVANEVLEQILLYCRNRWGKRDKTEKMLRRKKTGKPEGNSL